jgi:hypothetical protein
MHPQSEAVVRLIAASWEEQGTQRESQQNIVLLRASLRRMTPLRWSDAPIGKASVEEAMLARGASIAAGF